MSNEEETKLTEEQIELVMKAFNGDREAFNEIQKFAPVKETTLQKFLSLSFVGMVISDETIPEELKKKCVLEFLGKEENENDSH